LALEIHSSLDERGYGDPNWIPASGEAEQVGTVFSLYHFKQGKQTENMPCGIDCQANLELIVMMFVRSPPRRTTSKQRDRRPKDPRPLGAEFHVFVIYFCLPYANFNVFNNH